MSESIINYSFIGRLIRCYRIKMGITQKELLSATGNVCSLRTLSRIENGEEAKNKTKYTALVKYLNKEFDPQSFIWYEIQDYKKRLIYYINNEVELKKIRTISAATKNRTPEAQSRSVLFRAAIYLYRIY